MSGSGNDFIMVDSRSEPPGHLTHPAVVSRLCARGTGIGADGIVFLERSERAAVKLLYLNADGSPAELCGNATLCTTRLAIELGAAPGAGFEIETGAGLIAARMPAGGMPEIDLQPVSQLDLEPSALSRLPMEVRLGFAVVGVPHVTIVVGDVATVDVVGRGRPLRFDKSLPSGANVNFVSKSRDGGWTIRTYERGVEGETLACGTGAVASAALLTSWDIATSPVRLHTKSGRALTVKINTIGNRLYPSLSGDAEITYTGMMGEVLSGPAAES
jgi:diaminopimelate epimerase